jgi:hypothetical protein
LLADFQSYLRLGPPVLDNDKLRELELRKQVLMRLLPQVSERNQARVRAELSVTEAQIKLLRATVSDTGEPPPTPKPGTAA